MKGRQQREIRTLLNCKTFLNAHPAIAGMVLTSGSKRDLDEAVRDAGDHAAGQAYATRQRRAYAGVTKDAKRKLRQAMQPVAEVAKSTFQERPDMLGLMMPPASVATARLVAAALAMADGAEEVSDMLIAAGLAPGFADDIRSRARAVTEAAARGQEAVVARNGATRGITDAIRRGRRAIAVIDSLLAPAFDEAPDLRAGWKGLKRIPGKPGPSPM